MVYQSNTTEEQDQRRETEGSIFAPEIEQRNRRKTEEAEERRSGLIHENQKPTEGLFQETMAFSFPRRKTSSSGRPKLQRTNALKITDFELFSPSPSPSSSSSSSSSLSSSSSPSSSSSSGIFSSSSRKAFRFPSSSSSSGKRPSRTSFEKDCSSTFRLTGQNSESQIDRICEELGLLGGADAFGISLDAWEAGKSRTSSLDRFAFDQKFVDQKLPLSSSFDKKITTPFFDISKRNNQEKEAIFTQSSLSSSSVSLIASDSIASSSSSSGSSFFSDTTSSTPAGSLEIIEDHDSVQNDWILGDLTDRERISERAEQAVQQNPLPVPPIHTKSPLHSLSTHDLLASFAPETGHLDNDQKLISESRGNSNACDSLVRECKNGVSTDENVLSSTIDQEPWNQIPQINTNSWRKLEILGSGSFGTVYEAMSENGVYFAVKEVSLSLNDSKTQQSVSQLEQEIDVLSKFQHDNIVRYLGTQKEPEKLYIFLELVTKGSLAALYRKYPLYDSQIRIYTRQILSGLTYLHDHNIMHRDIKCANILVDVNGRIKLADFGLAKKISKLDDLNSCKGTAHWMAPEVIDPRKTYSFPADIWSLGCTVLEMVTRCPPFGDLEPHRALWKIGNGEPPPIPDSLSEDAKDFIRQCLQADPEKRPSCAQLLEHPFVRYVGLTPSNSFS